jgi:hypothetical protein
MFCYFYFITSFFFSWTCCQCIVYILYIPVSFLDILYRSRDTSTCFTSQTPCWLHCAAVADARQVGV